MEKPPEVNISELPSSPPERTETELELFGQHLFFIRNRRLAAIRRLVQDQAHRGRLGTIHRRPYERVAALEPAAREAALSLAKTAIDLYMQDLLSLFANLGTDLKLGEKAAIRYKLCMEIIDSNLNVLSEDLLNRNISRHLPSYFGRWLNRYNEWGAGVDGPAGRDSIARDATDGA